MTPHIQFTGGELVTVYNRQRNEWRRVPNKRIPRKIVVPERGGQPKSIGQLLHPIEQIIAHPDRNRLMAEFCKKFL